MLKPFKFSIFCEKTRSFVSETNQEPHQHQLETWEETNEPNVRVRKQTKTVYIDTRYEAKLRLYNYVTYIRKGLPIPRYRPFDGTEIGKSTPILNF